MFAIHGHLLPRVRSYEEAAALFEKLPVIRADDTRALGRKSDYSKRVVKVFDSYQFIYHQTPLVIWHPDKIVVKSYDSQSSVIFANRFLPASIYAMNDKGEMYYTLGDKYYMQKYGTGLVFNHTGDSWHVDLDTAATFSTKVLDKPRAARVRKMMKPFMDWLKAVDRLGGEPELQNNSANAAIAALRTVAREDTIPEHAYKELGVFSFFRQKDPYPQHFVSSGCVDQVALPLGSLKKKSRYDGIFNI